MTDVKISALGAANTAAAGSIPIVQSGVTKKLAATAAGVAVLAATDAAAQRTAMGLGTLATQDLPASGGAADTIGTATLVAGTVTITTTAAHTASKILYARRIAGGTLGHLAIANIVDGTSFDIVSTNALDTSTVTWEIRA